VSQLGKSRRGSLSRVVCRLRARNTVPLADRAGRFAFAGDCGRCAFCRSLRFMAISISVMHRGNVGREFWRSNQLRTTAGRQPNGLMRHRW
jgi:hypothetical protein